MKKAKMILLAMLMGLLFLVPLSTEAKAATKGYVTGITVQSGAKKNSSGIYAHTEILQVYYNVYGKKVDSKGNVTTSNAYVTANEDLINLTVKGTGSYTKGITVKSSDTSILKVEAIEYDTNEFYLDLEAGKNAAPGKTVTITVLSKGLRKSGKKAMVKIQVTLQRARITDYRMLAENASGTVSAEVADNAVIYLKEGASVIITANYLDMNFDSWDLQYDSNNKMYSTAMFTYKKDSDLLTIKRLDECTFKITAKKTGDSGYMMEDQNVTLTSCVPDKNGKKIKKTLRFAVYN